MRLKLTATAAAAALAAAGAASGALALEGAYVVPGEDETFTFADGYLSGTTDDGIMIHEGFVIEGDQVSFTAPDEHPLCPGAVGTYTFVETDTTVVFTLVEDSCEPRAAGMTLGPWTKVEE
jgi:hypothetical protein